MLRCGDRWAELERYVPHERLPPELGSYAWLFGAMGTLHRTLAGLDLPVPRPLVSTYAPPGSLRRWLPATEAAVAGDLEAAEIARLLHDLVRRLRGQWVPASASSTSDDDGIPADALTVAGANWRLPILWCSVSRHDADTARLQPDGCLVWAELTRW